MNGIRQILLVMIVALVGLSPPAALSSPERGALADQPARPTPNELADLIQRGQIALLRAALDGGADVNSVTGSVTGTQRHWQGHAPVGSGIYIDPGTTLLNLAVADHQLDIAQLLIAAGADVDEPDANPQALRPLQTAARIAATCCDQSQAGADARRQVEIRSGELISLLLAHGALIDARSGAGYSALHYAAASDNVAAIERLLAAGVPVDSRTGQRSATMPADPLAGNPFYALPAATPLIIAVHRRAQRAARDLMMHHANVNAQTLDGVTPLLLAVGGGDTKMVVLLLNEGADVNLASRLPPPYNRPVLYAQSKVDLWPQYLDIVDILVLRGAHLDPLTRGMDVVRRAFYECCYFPVSH